MPTKEELIKQYQAEIAAHPEKAKEKIHPVDWGKIRAERQANTRSTRICFNAYSNVAAKIFKDEKDRYFSIGVDPQISVDLMNRALRAFSDKTLHEWVEQGHHEPSRGTDEQELPNWAKD